MTQQPHFLGLFYPGAQNSATIATHGIAVDRGCMHTLSHLALQAAPGASLGVCGCVCVCVCVCLRLYVYDCVGEQRAGK